MRNSLHALWQERTPGGQRCLWFQSTTHTVRQQRIDCLITKTIPIYWGCPNISDFFDTSYWIRPDRIFSTEYTDTYYKDNREKIEANFEKAQRYARPLLTRVLETADLLAANE
jgi:hypothetical protein